MDTPLFTNDAIILGILIGVLALIFHTKNIKTTFWKKFYTFLPALLLCYFVPGILNSVGIIDGENSQLYFMASRYLLPASLVLLTLSIDWTGIKKIGPKALIMTFTATGSVIIGGPLAIIIISAFAPDLVGGAGPEAMWRGLATIAGSWIGGGANQTAMKEVFGVSDSLFSAIIPVDVAVYSMWMAVLLYGAGISDKIDKKLKADNSSIEDARKRIEDYHLRIARIPSLEDFMKICAVGLGITAIGHLGADLIAPYLAENHPGLAKFSLTSSFFWIVLIATTGGLIMSFTPVRELEGAGASDVGSLFLYILIATIGMQMNILSIFDRPGLLLVVVVWMLIHAIIIITVGKLIKAPFFFIAVGSQANIGGAASAPIVAAAFHPSLATIGVLLAVLGYAMGTYGAWLCAILMQTVAPQ